jgi:hypothetical protein
MEARQNFGFQQAMNMKMEAAPGFEPGIRDLQSHALATWPCRPKKKLKLLFDDK